MKTQTSREQFMARLNQVDSRLAEQLLAGKLQLVDRAISVTKSVSAAQNVKMIKTSDTKTTGVNMLHNGRLNKDEIFLLSEIRILGGIGSGTTENVATISAVEFGQIEKIIRGGHFEMKVNNKIIIPETSLEVFANNYFAVNATTDQSSAYAYNSAEKFGTFVLDNPKLLYSQLDIELFLDWGVAATSNGFLKVILKGSSLFVN
jgi:hypothetical protein